MNIVDERIGEALYGAYGDYVEVAVGGFVHSRFFLGGVGEVLPFFCGVFFRPSLSIAPLFWEGTPPRRR